MTSVQGPSRQRPLWVASGLRSRPHHTRRQKTPQADLLFTPRGAQHSKGSRQLPRASQPASVAPHGSIYRELIPGNTAKRPAVPACQHPHPVPNTAPSIPSFRPSTQRPNILYFPWQRFPALPQFPYENMPSPLAQGHQSFHPWPDCTQSAIKFSPVA